MKKKCFRLFLMLMKFSIYGFVMQAVTLTFLIAADINAQHIKSVKESVINLNIRNAGLEEIFREIENKTHYTFHYDRKIIDKDFTTSLNGKNKSVYDFLLELSEASQLNFKQLNAFISVYKAKPEQLKNEIEIIIQTRNITGKVTSYEDGEGLPGVNVLEKGTTNGTVTDVQGNYSLEVSEGATLVFSSVGYTPEEVEVGNRSSIDLTMTQDIQQLQELVVVGYGAMKKSDLTGAVEKINPEEIDGIATSSLNKAMQGRAAGVQIAATSGKPGADISVNIRGVSSINGNQPLYVIDGIPMSPGTFGIDISQNVAGDKSGIFNMINPSDIESIEILKDASSSAIYGSRGASGVVLITTKRGRESAKPIITLDSYYGLQNSVGTYNVINSRQFAENSNISQVNGGELPYPIYSDLDAIAQGPNTNWQDEVLRTAPITNHSINVSGGNEKILYSVGGGYYDQQGIIIGSDFDRYSFKTKLDMNLSKRIKVGTSINFSSSEENVISSGFSWGDAIWANAITTTPLIPVKNEDGSWGGPRNEPGELGNILNPVAQATDWQNRLNNRKLFGNVYAEIEIIEGLTYRIFGGADLFWGKSRVFSPSYEYGENVNPNAGLRVLNGNSEDLIINNTVSFNRTFSDHSINAMIGHEAATFDYYGITAFRQQFPNNELRYLNLGGTEGQTLSENPYWSSLESYFGRINYVFQDKYLLTAIFRADGSSKFGPENKWGYFPSISGAWRINEEAFMANVEFINNLKVRVGYGKNGNQSGIRNYAYLPQLVDGQMVFNGQEGVKTFNYGTFANPEVKWETVTQTNVGIDLSLFNNRIEFTADFYNKETSDMLLPRNVPKTTGLPNRNGEIAHPPVMNIGSMENKGFELSLTTVNMQSDLIWTTDLNFSMNRNKIISLAGDGEPIEGQVGGDSGGQFRIIEGEPIGLFYGHVYDGIFANQAEVDAHAEQPLASPGDVRFSDLNNDGVIDDKDRTFIGNSNPKFIYGMNNRFDYKGFDLNIFIQGVQGNDIYNVTHKEISTSLQADIAKRWYNPGDNATLPRLTSTDGNDNYRTSSLWVEDGSYLKIRDITLGYTFNSLNLKKLHVENLRAYISAQNYFTFTNYSGLDPEIGNYFSDIQRTGYDWFPYPMAKTIMFGINVKF